MKIAIIGNHAGAHYISNRLVDENTVELVYHIGANQTIQPSKRYVPIISADVKSIVNFLNTTDIDLVFLMTMNHLYNKTIQDTIRNRKIPSCSVGVDLSMLEWSKITGKKLLNELGIPTANSRVLKKNQLFQEFFNIPRPWVLKFEKDWRAGLQTVIITDQTVESEFKNLQKYGQVRYMSGLHGNFQDQHFIVEDYIQGSREYSYHIIANEVSQQYLGSARDYKKFLNGDQGTNSASMGCYSPVDINPLVHEYADRILSHLRAAGTPYIGVLYLGIMEDVNGKPYVLEINTRPGDPEFQSIVENIDRDQSIAKLLLQTATNSPIDNIQRKENNYSVCLRIVNSRYHDIINMAISKQPLPRHVNPQLWPELPDITICFNADRKLLNSVITTSAPSLKEASDRIYGFLENIEMNEFTYRTDIGYLK